MFAEWKEAQKEGAVSKEELGSDLNLITAGKEGEGEGEGATTAGSAKARAFLAAQVSRSEDEQKESKRLLWKTNCQLRRVAGQMSPMKCLF